MFISSILLIVLTVALPLVIFLKKNEKNKGMLILYCIFFMLLWWLQYAPLHEFSHYLAERIRGTKIIDYQLLPIFWEGEFKRPYIELGGDGKASIIGTLAPYIKSLLFVIAGYFIIKKSSIKRIFLMGAVLIIFVLTSMFDVIDNYMGFVLYNFGDFKLISNLTNPILSYVVGLLFCLAISTVALLSLKILYSKSYK